MTQKEPKEFSQIDETNELVKLTATVSMDEIAAIQVSRWEEDLLLRQIALRKSLAESEKEVVKLSGDLPKLVDKDTRKHYPEVVQVETGLKSLFGKSVHMNISLSGEDKVVVSVSNAISCYLTWKGEESKEQSKKILAAKKAVKEIEDKLCEVKKGLGMLPFIERRAKAKVAEAKLSQSKQGLTILNSIGDITIPGLPAPK